MVVNLQVKYFLSSNIKIIKDLRIIKLKQLRLARGNETGGKKTLFVDAA